MNDERWVRVLIAVWAISYVAFLGVGAIYFMGVQA